MTKRSRRPSTPRPSPANSARDASATQPAESTGSGPTDSATTTTSRPTTRTTRRRAAAPESPFARYRGVVLAGVALVGVLIIGFLFFQSSGGTAYACESQLTPGPVESVTPRPATPAPTPLPSLSASPTPSGSPDASASPAPSATPEPEPTARLGFTTSILGANHIPNPNEQIQYGFCPPTSGDHYNVAGRGPIRAAVYPRAQEQMPGGWVHNLEHGWVVALYRCTGPDDCPSDAEMAQMQQFVDESPSTTTCPKQVLVARFDDMETRFAYLAWGRALLTDEFSLDTSLLFAQQWIDAFAPENATC